MFIAAFSDRDEVKPIDLDVVCHQRLLKLDSWTEWDCYYYYCSVIVTSHPPPCTPHSTSSMDGIQRKLARNKQHYSIHAAAGRCRSLRHSK